MLMPVRRGHKTPPKQERGGQSRDPPKTRRQSRRTEGTPIDFWKVMGLEHGNGPQEAGWMIACVAQS